MYILKSTILSQVQTVPFPFYHPSSPVFCFYLPRLPCDIFSSSRRERLSIVSFFQLYHLSIKWEVNKTHKIIVLICQIMRYVGQSLTKNFSGGSPYPSKKKPVSQFLNTYLSMLLSSPSLLLRLLVQTKKKNTPPHPPPLHFCSPPLLALHLFYN